MTVTSAFPIVSTPDLERLLAFYVDLLGGQVGYRFPPDGDPDFVSMDLGTGHLGVGVDPSVVTGPAGQRFSLWVYVSDVDATVTQVRSAGLDVVLEPRDEPWGERVAHVRDPDGNLVVLGQREVP